MARLTGALMQPIEFGGNQFIARADRTLFHLKTHTLFLSDLHLGKGAHFRQSGIPVPDGGEFHDLDRLVDAINDTESATVWILGDLFHHPRSITRNQMDCWIDTLQRQQATLKVILGNHDRDAHSIAENLGFSIYPEPPIGTVSSSHIILITDLFVELLDTCTLRWN